jgi:uncharacterized DUF497 family protein
LKHFAWDSAKNERLRRERGISFEEVAFHIANGDVLEILEHPNPEKYKGQQLFVVQIGEYAYLVPFVEELDQIVLKTIIPSRKATKLHLKRGKSDEVGS